MIVSWNTTNACNLNCPHCYRDAGKAAPDELTTSEAKTLLEQISAVGASFKPAPTIMIFSGGEPLLREDIFELVEYAAKQGLRPVFGTNGTLLTRDIARRLKESGAAAMGISLDSTDADKHDRFRGMPGAFDRTIEGMRNCREIGLRFQIHTTVMDWNYDEIEKLTDLAVELGSSAHHIFFLVPTGRAVLDTGCWMLDTGHGRTQGSPLRASSIEYRASRYEQLLERIMDKQRETPIELKPTCAPQFMRIAKQKGMEMRFTRGCIAGISYCLIGPTGDVQPCAYLDMRLGNVREIPFTEIWRSSPVFKELRTMNYRGACGICDYKDVCGGCRARAAYYHKGDYMASEPWCTYRPNGLMG